MRFHSSGHTSLIEILEGSDGRRSRGRTFEGIFQIVIMVEVEATNGQDLLRTLQLALDEAVFSAGVGPQCQTTVAPSAAWCGNGWVFAKSQSTARRGSGRSKESAAAILWLGVSGFLLKVLAALLGARPPSHRTAGSSARRDGVPHLPRSSPATLHGSE